MNEYIEDSLKADMTTQLLKIQKINSLIWNNILREK